MGLESYQARYTYQLTDWTERVYKKRGIDYVIVPGTTIDDSEAIVTGQVLDAHGRSYFGMSQMMNLVQMMKAGEVTKEDIVDEFNQDIANLVEGVTKLSGIKFNSKKQEQAENFMKMFISMAKDIRVILIKFADRLHNMSTLDYLSIQKQQRIAIETKEVYAPLAHRLGMNNVKTQMEDLVLKTCLLYTSDAADE